jgi:hypothetical protein
MTHLSLFVDERLRRHYLDYATLHLPENFARSAVYGLQRPLDKVLHSIVVATEVLLFREYVTGHDSHTGAIHPATERLLAGTLASIESTLDLQRRRPVLAPRGIELVSRCRELLGALSVSTKVA